MSERTRRRLAAIVAADVAGYSRLIGADEEGTLRALRGHRVELIDPLLQAHDGRIANTAGDSLLLVFSSVVDAVRFALAMQPGMAERDADIEQSRQIRFRVGINVGDVIAEGEDLLGDGVNIAARVEALADPGGIAISDDAYRQVRDRLHIEWQDGGEHEVKNIARPIQVWQWSAEAQVDFRGDSHGLGAALPLPDKPSIAVLPFDNMSGDPEQEYFADGISEDIITTLSKIPDLFVIARNSTFTYKGTAIDVKQVARELGVRYVVEGSVRKAGNRVRISAQLIDATTGRHRWAERYDRDLGDFFALQDEMTREIVTAVDVELTEGEQIRVWRESAGDLAAYEHFARGRDHFSRMTAKAMGQARQEFEMALSLDPRFAAAHAYVGWTHAVAGVWWSEDRDAAFAAARAAVDRALSLNDSLADAHVVRAFVDLHSGEHARAERVADKAATLKPNGADIHNVLAMILNFSGMSERALVAARHAGRLSPRALHPVGTRPRLLPP